MTALAILLTVPLAAGGQVECSDAERLALLRAQEQIARGDDTAARAALDVDGQWCTARRLAALALRGWIEARALASGGGAIDLQGPVRRTLGELDALAADSPYLLDIEYAVTCIRAAIAAAQDERPEMELLLAHARDLAERLAARDRRALWPRPFNIAAGELWFEVDRFADALAAYERAVRADASPLALVGLTRSLLRLDRVTEACAAARKISGAAAALREAVANDLERCQ